MLFHYNGDYTGSVIAIMFCFGWGIFFRLVPFLNLTGNALLIVTGYYFSSIVTVVFKVEI